ncbi:hypothetical protein PoB_006568800 [Plakobranchus ocellatus]|uniref:Uncharacterized protein n=1 Tax=Plakobranchus ocellatus TaxID=259542 RepID=A0AAV4D4X3_9GAST|nr:hypothetical protein PoB_006568800 [Plakobranchus ocellatus]
MDIPFANSIARVSGLREQSFYQATIRLEPIVSSLPTTFESAMQKSGTSRIFSFRLVLYTASPQQDDLRLSGPPSSQGANGGAQTEGYLQI